MTITPIGRATCTATRTGRLTWLCPDEGTSEAVVATRRSTSADAWGHRLPEDEPTANPKLSPAALAFRAGVVSLVDNPRFYPLLALAP
jgi:hypothetical protein